MQQMFIVTLYIGLSVVVVYSLFNLWLIKCWYNCAKKQHKASNQSHVTSTNPRPTIDIIVAVRNEALLNLTITSLAQQQYPTDKYQIILVDDFTNDVKSLSVLAQIQESNWPVRLKIIRLCDELPKAYEQVPNKKRALEIGAKASTAQYLLFTDGDCIAHPRWLETLTDYMADNNLYKMVLAGIKPLPGSGFIHQFASSEQAALTIVAGGSLLAGIPLMANGANLYISREVFEEINGYSPWLDKPSGDDIILLRKVHQKYPKEIGFCFHSKAIIETRFPKDFSSFWNQRRRWVSKSLSMPSKQITAVILLIFFTQVCMIALLGVMGFAIYQSNIKLLWLSCSGIFLKTFIDSILIALGFRYIGYKMKLRDYLLMPLHQLVNIVYNMALGLYSLASNGKGYLWKGRKVTKTP